MTEQSDGSTANYYRLPQGATELQDLISDRDMNSQIGEIFRACYRYGQASHSSRMRDARKILFYAVAEVERLEKLAVKQRAELEARCFNQEALKQAGVYMTPESVDALKLMVGDGKFGGDDRVLKPGPDVNNAKNAPKTDDFTSKNSDVGMTSKSALDLLRELVEDKEFWREQYTPARDVVDRLIGVRATTDGAFRKDLSHLVDKAGMLDKVDSAIWLDELRGLMLEYEGVVDSGFVVDRHR